MQNCVKMFEKLVQHQTKGLLLTNSMPLDDPDFDDELDEVVDGEPLKGGKKILLAQEVRNAFQQAGHSSHIRGTSFTQIRWHGVSYCIRERHEGNSGIFLKGKAAPFCIENIVQVDGSNEIWLVVRHHRLPDIKIDPYANYPYLKASIWEDALEDEVEVVQISDVETHFAKCVVPREDFAQNEGLKGIRKKPKQVSRKNRTQLAIIVSLSRVSPC